MKPSRKNKATRKTSTRLTPPRRSFAADSLKIIVPLVAVTIGLKSLIFAPISFWPLSFVCLVPWLMVVTTSTIPRRVYVSSFVVGFGSHLIIMYWMSHVTVVGYLLWSACVGIYFPLMACPLRHWVRRRRLPMAVGLPIVWVACEYVRAWMLTGFPWFFLAHSPYKLLSLIQISDLFGAYSVSFVIAAVNGAIFDLLLPRLGGIPIPATGGRELVEGLKEPAFSHGRTALGHATRAVTELPPRRSWAGPVFAVVLLLATLVYGQVQLRRDTMSPGPKVAVIQGDYPLFVDMNRPRKRADEKAERYFEFMAHAEAEEPDLFLLPETPWRMYLNREYLELDPAEHYDVLWSRRCSDLFRAWAKEMNATVVTGAFSVVPTPLSLRSEQINYNSAFVYAPDGSPAERYDKCHRVVFGEYIPFRDGKLRFLYFWLHRFVPLAWLEEGGTYEYSLTSGEEFKVFRMRAPSRGGREYRFGIPICYEDVMPYVSRRFVTGPDGAKQADFLANISNDGWFVHSNELPQHLAIGAFRAVENRIGIARAVNTGISGFVDPNGFIHDLVTAPDGRCHGPGIDGFSVANVMVDSRHSLYSRIGDVFAQVCMVLWVVFYADYLVVRALGRRWETYEEEMSP